MGFSLSDLNPFDSGSALNPSRLGEKVFGSAASMFDPKNIYRSFKAAVDDPKATMRFLEDSAKNPNWKQAPNWLGGNILGLARQDVLDGQIAADNNRQDFGGMTNEDLYRRQSEGGGRPRDNPFEAQNYDQFSGAYAARGSPRVYSSDNSFVYPNTEPVQQNTALIPSTGMPATPAQVTGAPSAPGAAPGGGDTSAASMFRIPQRKRSSSVVR